MAALTQPDLETPSSNAIASARQTDHRILMEIEGVGRHLATELLDLFGSRYGVQQAATRHWGTLECVDGISRSMAIDFQDRMEEADALIPNREEGEDAIRRAHRAEMNRRVEGESAGEFTILDVKQVVAGLTVPAMWIKVEPVSADFDAPSGKTPHLFTRCPQGTDVYEALLAHLELPSHTWQSSPESVIREFRDRIEGRTMPFHYQHGFVVKLDSELYQI